MTPGGQPDITSTFEFCLCSRSTPGAPDSVSMRTLDYALIEPEHLSAAYFLSSSFGSTSATNPNFVFPFSAPSTPTIQNCSGVPARSS